MPTRLGGGQGNGKYLHYRRAHQEWGARMTADNAIADHTKEDPDNSINEKS